MSLFKGEQPSLGTTIFTATNKGDNVITVTKADGTVTYTVSDAGTITNSGDQTITGNVTVTGNSAVTGTLAVTGAQTFTGATALNGGATVATAKTLVVTDADALTVNAIKIPQTWTVTGISKIVTPATAGWAWIAPRACKVVSVKEVHSAGTAGVTINVRKITDASAPSAAAGATVKEILSAGLNANFTANTVSTGALSATASDYTFAAGDKLAWNASGTLTSYTGDITVEFQAV